MDDNKGHYGGCKYIESQDYNDCNCEKWRYFKVLTLGLSALMLEIWGGWMSGSLALLADAGHVLADVSNNIVSLFVSFKAKGAHDEVAIRNTGAKIGLSILGVAIVIIIYEAIDRILHPTETIGWLMFLVAVIGAYINYIMERELHGSPDEEKNITNSVMHLHVKFDLYLSYVVIATSVIKCIPPAWIDPIASIGIAILISANIRNFFSPKDDDEHSCSHHH